MLSQRSLPKILKQSDHYGNNSSSSSSLKRIGFTCLSELLWAIWYQVESACLLFIYVTLDHSQTMGARYIRPAGAIGQSFQWHDHSKFNGKCRNSNNLRRPYNIPKCRQIIGDIFLWQFVSGTYPENKWEGWGNGAILSNQPYVSSEHSSWENCEEETLRGQNRG